MFQDQNYLDIAKQNEAVFRSILRDLKENRDKRPMGHYIPTDLDTESPIDELFKKYSKGDRFGIFTITGFDIKDNKAIISFRNIAVMSGGGAVLGYSINNKTGSAKYIKKLFSMMS